MSKTSQIFLSYSYADKGVSVERLIRDLRNVPNIVLWEAEQQIENGEPIFQSISKAISECDYFINIPSFHKSHWVDIELQLAYADEVKNQNLKIITCEFRNVNSQEKIIGRGHRGVVINFGLNYDLAFAELTRYIIVNSASSLISFDLDTSINRQTIIDISSNINEKLIAYFANHPENLKRMDRRLFEELVAELFNGFGFQVELTQKTRDGGRDIVAIKNEEAQLKYLIECKRPDDGNTVGVKPVRELFGVKQDEKASKAILATTSYFSKDATLFFERNKWELEPKDFNGIVQWIDTYKRKKNIA